jgi:hypothetical protein
MRNHILGSALFFGLSMLQPIGQNLQQGSIDAVIAAPASHTVLLENSRVRVLQVTIPPGVTEPVHTHEWPSIMQVEAPQPLTYITYTMQDGKWVEAKRFDVPLGKPVKAQWMKPEGPHAVQNRGTSEYQAIRIELKPGSPTTDQ